MVPAKTYDSLVRWKLGSRSEGGKDLLVGNGVFLASRAVTNDNGVGGTYSHVFDVHDRRAGWWVRGW